MRSSPDGHAYSFDAGTFSLELLLTGGPGMYARWESLHQPDDLVRWLGDSMLGVASSELAIGDDEFARIKEFRNALLAVVLRTLENKPADPADVATINAAAGEPPVPRLDPVTLKPHWSTPVTGRQVLAAAAADAMAALASGRIKQCSGDNCYLLYLDTSRPGNRRWCSMEHCGNRNKVRAHRARARD